EVEVERAARPVAEDEDVVLLRRRRAREEVPTAVPSGAFGYAAEEGAGSEPLLLVHVRRRGVVGNHGGERPRRVARRQRRGELTPERVDGDVRQGAARRAEVRLEDALVAFVIADADEALLVEAQLELRLVVQVLAATLPVEVPVR